ncbi:hypothetical protein NEOLI_005066 [Neolecta irregularis DAH-3]|uniref:Uncharacterized protein n=1 Tax=Neolecta irregularis (strain DAH-3) TaxID=1198029 RepID=A0A1U7LL99_NEOID|nr:hypothetical protein NEOLI_005066 [Neolecta irregularis DAH-3]|eukprot:OLL23408.1 hypothetical protein NEOLI_005066 [Neolecta irregularis DAH-3]
MMFFIVLAAFAFVAFAQTTFNLRATDVNTGNTSPLAFYYEQHDDTHDVQGLISTGQSSDPEIQFATANGVLTTSGTTPILQAFFASVDGSGPGQYLNSGLFQILFTQADPNSNSTPTTDSFSVVGGNVLGYKQTTTFVLISDVIYYREEGNCPANVPNCSLVHLEVISCE